MKQQDASSPAGNRGQNRSWIGLGIFLSLLAHIVLYILLREVSLPPPIAQKQRIPVRLEYKIKDKAKAEREKKDKSEGREEEKKTQQIVEVPLPETAPPDSPAYLGAQNHRTAREQKTIAGRGAKAAPPTALQSGALHIEKAPDAGGRIIVPRKGAAYANLLPQSIDVINPGHNDFIPNKNIPIGPVMDVNTTDFRFIGYFTSVRKQVDLAYYDVGPTLRDSPHVRERMDARSSGKIHYQGSSVVQLKVMRSGVLVEAKLNQSSGDKEIDEFWLRVLNLAAPYPPLPRDYPDDALVFTYSLYYDLVYNDQSHTKKLMF